MIFLWQLENIRTPFFNEIMHFVTYFGQELLITWRSGLHTNRNSPLLLWR